MNDIYPILIEDYNSSGIRSEARRFGATHMREIPCADGYRLFAIPIPEGWEIRVADTNGDPIWEEDDPVAFSAILEVDSE